MTTIINGSSPSITFSDGSAQTSATRPFLNRIINGAMMIDQRNAGASVTPSATGVNIYTVDRWAYLASQASKLTFQQNAGSVTPPAGFSNYLGITVASGATISSGDYSSLNHSIEGFNTADLNWGTANAKTVTLSFWVRSSLTGTFGGVVGNANDGTTNITRCYPFTYVINAANTWEQKSVTITGDTTGTWGGATNAIGIGIIFGLGVGSTYQGTAGSWAGANYLSVTGATNLMATNGATWYLTGVQLEVGSTATSFDYRPYGTELALCQRYFAKLGGTTSGENIGFGNLTDSASIFWGYVKFPVSMRSAPTASYSSLYITNNATYNLSVSSIRGQYNGLDSSNIGFNCGSSGTTYAATAISTSATAGYLAYSAEL